MLASLRLLPVRAWSGWAREGARGGREELAQVALAKKDAIVVFIYAYRRQPPRRSPSMEKIAAGALVTIDGQRRGLLERSAVNYHLRRMRAGNPDGQRVPAAYRDLVTWVAGEHNSVQLTRKGTRHAEQLLAADPGRFEDVVAAATRAADPSATPDAQPTARPGR